MKIISQRLARLHTAWGDSHEAAVEAITRKTGTSIGQSTYSAYLREAKTPGAENLTAMARFFRVSTDYLCGLTDDSRPVSELLARLKALDLPDDVAQAARDLLDVASEDKESLILQIKAAKAANVKWRSLAKFAGLNVNDLRIAVGDAVPQESGISEAALELS